MIPPTAFIFHESRVGSTLVANMFASDPRSLVFRCVQSCGYLALVFVAMPLKPNAVAAAAVVHQ